MSGDVQPQVMVDMSPMLPKEIVFGDRQSFGVFEVEVANDNGDAVFHFYNVSMPTALWDTEDAEVGHSFANALQTVSPPHFGLSYPALRAARTHDLEIDSWWLRASGVYDRLMPDVFITAYLNQMAEYLGRR